MSLILKMLGTPSEHQLSFITDQNAKKYISSFSKGKSLNWDILFPGIDANAREILEKTLAFRPKDRTSAKELLKLKFFDNYQAENAKSLSVMLDAGLENINWKSVDSSKLRRMFVKLLS